MSTSAPFIRPNLRLTPGWQSTANTAGEPATVYDLLEQSARLNAQHAFALQLAPSLVASDTRTISHGQLLEAVDRCSAWLVAEGIARRSAAKRDSGNGVERGTPVAIFLGSDANIFVYLVALTKLGNPFALFSSRLSAEAVTALCTRAGIRSILTDQRTVVTWAQCQQSLGEAEGEAVRQVDALPLAAWLTDASVPASITVEKGDEVDPNDCSVAIFHSSGSTGLPKPIFHCHRYLLGYAANHELSADAVGVTLSTLPLYHGFGLLAPCLSLSIGMTVVLPAATTIPTGLSTAAMLHLQPAKRIFIVPATLGEMEADAAGLALLQQLQQVVVGGAPMKLSLGERLEAAGVSLLNHFGVTEIGALAPICVPAPSCRYNWRYLLVRNDINIQLQTLPLQDGGGSLLRLGARPFGWADDFWVQDALEENADAGDGRRQVRIRGRVDELIVLATGEKVSPIAAESALREHPLVTDAVMFGNGRFQVGLIVETASTAGASVTAQDLGPTLDELNRVSDAHAQIDATLIVLTQKAKKALVRTPKGNPERKANVDLFAVEIEAAYRAADRVAGPLLDLDDAQSLEATITEAVTGLLRRRKGEIGVDDDFFELGMDSFKALKLLRMLQAGAGTLPFTFVYRNPSVAKLVAALAQGSRQDQRTDDEDAAAVQACVDGALRQLDECCPSSLRDDATGGHAPRRKPRTGPSIVITGSTGSLGSHLLRAALSQPHVEHVYCLVRGPDPLQRQLEVMAKLGVSCDRTRISVWTASLSKPKLGLTEAQYHELVTHATHIIHNAWPVDFLRHLASFQPHIDGLARLIELGVDISQQQQQQQDIIRPRLVFASSIAVVARYASERDTAVVVPEEPVVDVRACSTLGYAQAKLACEQLLQRAPFRHAVSMASVRIGQLTGAEGLGNWSTSEHMAALVKSSRTVGALPDLQGTLSWLPVNRAGDALVEILLSEDTTKNYNDDDDTPAMMHLENPARQSWPDMVALLGQAIAVDRVRPFDQWLQLVQVQCPDAGPLVDFFRQDFLRLATGSLVLDTAIAKRHSSTLTKSKPLDSKHVQEYVKYWRASGFL
ncbi:acetyl-CoA synthetase-like protein [Acaromyces ingoldii]|uniref:Acetyl-CoA synthetase-like protein n=1 Tax=Acaromyces ingoldii TaxID=215250 RepID=A0A316YF23_9BASI|nr:acetyl-CoA synthetase-like protein [Acaromyces ingoldii]PWN88007.1 acetyl-CoA synthetase-like protein [Acaromyces ingoldii]